MWDVNSVRIRFGAVAYNDDKNTTNNNTATAATAAKVEKYENEKRKTKIKIKTKAQKWSSFEFKHFLVLWKCIE